MSNWLFEGAEVTEIDQKYAGFIYIITQISTGMRYIGKKKSFFRKTALKTVTLKNGTKKKKKIRTLVPSDWPSYYGSSDTLKAEIEKCGVEDFSREIIKFCTTEAELSYHEAKVQFDTDCLLHPDRFFNSWIMVRCRRSNLIK